MKIQILRGYLVASFFCRDFTLLSIQLNELIKPPDNWAGAVESPHLVFKMDDGQARHLNQSSDMRDSSLVEAFFNRYRDTLRVSTNVLQAKREGCNFNHKRFYRVSQNTAAHGPLAMHQIRSTS